MVGCDVVLGGAAIGMGAHAASFSLSEVQLCKLPAICTTPKAETQLSFHLQLGELLHIVEG